MDTAVAVALITSATSVAIALATAVWTSRQSRIQSERADRSRTNERLEAERLEDARYLHALFDAALGLGYRIENIRHRAFLLAYLNGGDRRREAVLRTTAYRFARYIALAEGLSTRPTDVERSAVLQAVQKVSRAFSTDKGGPRFMLWPEEQKAIAQRMQPPAGSSVGEVIGYASFVEDYQDVHSAWWGHFLEDLREEGAEMSPRFEDVQNLLAQLLSEIRRESAARPDLRARIRMEDDEGRIPEWISRVKGGAADSPTTV